MVLGPAFASRVPNELLRCGSERKGNSLKLRQQPGKVERMTVERTSSPQAKDVQSGSKDWKVP